MGEQVEGLIIQDGFYLPDYDRERAPKFVPYLRKMTKDATLTAALAKGHELCVQAGGNIGMWPLALAWMYESVVTFEAQPKAFQALVLNTAHEPKITTRRNAALSDRCGHAFMLPASYSGAWRLDAEGYVEVMTVTIDSLGLPACDAIYLDIEGGERAALDGARETIKKFRPVLHVEMLPRASEDIKAFMAETDYRFVRSVHKDSIYVPN